MTVDSPKTLTNNASSSTSTLSIATASLDSLVVLPPMVSYTGYTGNYRPTTSLPSNQSNKSNVSPLSHQSIHPSQSKQSIHPYHSLTRHSDFSTPLNQSHYQLLEHPNHIQTHMHHSASNSGVEWVVGYNPNAPQSSNYSRIHPQKSSTQKSNMRHLFTSHYQSQSVYSNSLSLKNVKNSNSQDSNSQDSMIHQNNNYNDEYDDNEYNLNDNNTIIIQQTEQQAKDKSHLNHPHLMVKSSPSIDPMQDNVSPPSFVNLVRRKTIMKNDTLSQSNTLIQTDLSVLSNKDLSTTHPSHSFLLTTMNDLVNLTNLEKDTFHLDPLTSSSSPTPQLYNINNQQINQLSSQSPTNEKSPILTTMQDLCLFTDFTLNTLDIDKSRQGSRIVNGRLKRISQLDGQKLNSINQIERKLNKSMQAPLHSTEELDNEESSQAGGHRVNSRSSGSSNSSSRSSSLKLDESGSPLPIKKSTGVIKGVHSKAGGVSVTLLQHLDVFRKSVKATNDTKIQFEFAKFCIESSENMPDPEMRQSLIAEGYFWLKKICTSNGDAAYYLGEAYIHDQNYDAAFYHFLSAAKRFHPQSCFAAAQAYEKGVATKMDKHLALQFYKKSALSGHKPAMYRLGLAFLQGELKVKRNVKESIKYLKRCVPGELPHAEAMYQLHLIYESGMPNDCILADIQYSKSVLLESAYQGYCPALCKMGKCYDQGLLLYKVNPNEAIHWYTLAAKQGYPEAEYILSGVYLNGMTGLSSNPKLAFDFAKSASLKGHAKATFAIGYFYENGIGVKINVKKSVECFYAAAKLGDSRGLKKMRGTIHENEFVKEHQDGNKCRMM